MSAGPIKIIDATDKNIISNPKQKSKTYTMLYFITLVYHRKITKEEPDWAYFKQYLNDKLTEFLRTKLRDCLKTFDQELLEMEPPSFTFDISLEHNSKQLLHHHCIIGITFPRVMPETGPRAGKLSRWLLSYVKFNQLVRESMGLGDHGISTKVDIREIGGNISSIDNLKRYILKNV